MFFFLFFFVRFVTEDLVCLVHTAFEQLVLQWLCFYLDISFTMWNVPHFTLYFLAQGMVCVRPDMRAHFYVEYFSEGEPVNGPSFQISNLS